MAGSRVRLKRLMADHAAGVFHLGLAAWSDRPKNQRWPRLYVPRLLLYPSGRPALKRVPELIRVLRLPPWYSTGPIPMLDEDLLTTAYRESPKETRVALCTGSHVWATVPVGHRWLRAAEMSAVALAVARVQVDIVARTEALETHPYRSKNWDHLAFGYVQPPRNPDALIPE